MWLRIAAAALGDRDIALAAKSHTSISAYKDLALTDELTQIRLGRRRSELARDRRARGDGREGWTVRGAP